MKIYQLETKNGRIFRVAIENQAQFKRLSRLLRENQARQYEKFVRVESVNSGIHTIKQLEALAVELQ